MAGPGGAALDELSRNFTYGALGAGNGSLSGAWYRRNQDRVTVNSSDSPFSEAGGS